MKILVIMGSPHKGETYKITRRVEEKMKALGEVEFSYVFLKEVKLENCRGCLGCFKKGIDVCPIKDERANIEQMMISHDAIVFASPVYVFNVSAYMKNFIERFAYYCHRPYFYEKYALIVCTTEAIGLKEPIMYLDGVARGWGFNSVSRIGAIRPVMPSTDKNEAKIERDIDKSAKEFYYAIKNKKPHKPALINLIGFKLLRALFLLPLSEETVPANFYYFKSKINNKFYYDENTIINPVKNFIAWAVVKAIMPFAVKFSPARITE